jgi:acetyl esterase/lipase
MASLPAELVKLYSRAVIKRRPRDGEALVRHLRRAMNHSPLPKLMPRGVRIERMRLGGRPCERVAIERPREAVLYLHGGGHVAGVTKTYHSLAGRLARALSAEVFLPVYRLAPEHPFPAGRDDALAAYEALLARGITPESITVAGDSAGGGLALSLLFAVRDRGLPLPRCAVLLSPYADLTGSRPSVEANDRSDAMLSAHLLRLAGELCDGGIDLRSPAISPAYGDFRGLPPLYVTVCNDECLLDDALGVVERAREAGVAVDLVRGSGVLHVWPFFVPYVSVANEDVARIIAFIRRMRFAKPDVAREASAAEGPAVAS